MSARQFLAIFLITAFASFCGGYLAQRAQTQTAFADPAVGNGAAGSAGVATLTVDGATITNTGTATNPSIAFSNPITATITSNVSNPLAFTNATGPTSITSAATTNAAFQLNSTAPTSGHLLDIMKAGSICIDVTATGTLFASTNCDGSMQVGNHYNQSATNAFAGTCAFAATTTCTATLTHSFTTAGVCFVQPLTGQTYSSVSGLSFQTTAITTSSSVVITAIVGGAATSETGTVNYTCFGNPS